MKLAIIVGTRPEIIRLSATINLCRKIFEVSLIHTGQNYDYNLNEAFFKDLEIGEPDYYLDCNGGNVGKTIGNVISKTYELFLEIKPDALLILGDTNSCLSSYSAKRLKIPIFHLEAGNRCFDQNVPEEINRKMIDHISDINMCYMEHARHNLLKENISSQYLFVVGSPIPEILKNVSDKITDTILDKFNLPKNSYFVWSCHREENIDNPDNFNKIVNSINMLCKIYDRYIIFTVHPRTRKMIEKNNIVFEPGVILSEPLGLLDYYALQKNAYCVISDSGTVTEEANILDFKAVLLRTSTEHPEGIDSGDIVIGNINWENVNNAVRMTLMSKTDNLVINYIDTNFSEKVCKIIIGYTDIINKNIWKKQ